MTPYTTTQVTNKYIIREFNENVDPIELVWHRDQEDRLLNVIGDSTNWMIQLEDELPIPIDGIYIKKDVYHRLVKGTGTLTLKITKYVDSSGQQN